MTRNSFFQMLTILALVAAIVFVAHNFVKYVLKVDGSYSHWTVFSECTKPCGIGTRFRTRTCDNPPPRFGGLNCSRLGDDKQTFRCNMNPCPVDGGYGEWGEFSKCTVTCGGGVRHRTRECDNPKTVLPGKTCQEQGLGSAEEMETCNVESCPVDGGYTEWSEFSECSVTCGGGVSKRTRQCSNPAPENNGKDCEQLGPAKESQICNTEACPAEPPQDVGKVSVEDVDNNEEQANEAKEKREEKGKGKKQGDDKESEKNEKKRRNDEENRNEGEKGQ